MQNFDTMIVGAGVAGLTAALFAAHRGLKTGVVDRYGAGGQLLTIDRVQNFPGFPEGIAGYELGPLLHRQGEAAGAEFMLDSVEAIAPHGDDGIFVHGADEAWHAKAVIIAAGSTPKKLGVPGEAEFVGRGVSHCASCDGPLYAGENVCVIGGGDSALDEALVLAQAGARVCILHRGPRFDAQSALQNRVAEEGIEAVFGVEVDAILGGESVTAVQVRNIATGSLLRRETKGVFVYIGLTPNTAFAAGAVRLDPSGRIETDTMMRTSAKGIFAAGDVRAGSVAEFAAAAGDGATAAIAAFQYLREHPEHAR